MSSGFLDASVESHFTELDTRQILLAADVAKEVAVDGRVYKPTRSSAPSFYTGSWLMILTGTRQRRRIDCYSISPSACFFGQNVVFTTQSNTLCLCTSPLISTFDRLAEQTHRNGNRRNLRIAALLADSSMPGY